MGNYESCTVVVGMKECKIIQLVSSDGTVQILQKPLRDGQIMHEFPHHLRCNFHSFFIGQKMPPLSPNEQLEMGNKYFLLPDHFFRSELMLNTLELQKDYEQLVMFRGQCWRLKLETSREKEKRGNCYKLIFKMKRLSLNRC